MGDIFYGGDCLKKNNNKEKQFYAIFSDFLELLTGCDILVANLEGPFFRSNYRRSDVTVHLWNDPEIMKLFRYAKATIVSLANNHIMDYGREGLENTVSILHDNGIYYAGAGQNIREAEKPAIISVNGKRIGFLCLTSESSNIGSIIAGNETEGCASYDDRETVIDRVRKLSSELDAVCVILHWGMEYYQYPSPDQVQFAHALADAGAQFVIGHHPHTIQGIEKYHDSFIAYSLGNFFFSDFIASNGRLKVQKSKAKEIIGIKAVLPQRKKGISSICYSGKRITDGKIHWHNGEEKRIFENQMIKLSEPLGKKEYLELWDEYKIRRNNELQNEALKEAFKKIFLMSPHKIIKSLTIDDFKRNFSRILKLLKKDKIG